MLQQVGDHQVNDLARGEIHTEGVSHVPRPFNRAHAQHRGGGIGAPAPVVLGRHLSPGLIPKSLGVEKHSVKVEHHRPDHVPSITGTPSHGPRYGGDDGSPCW